MTDFGLLAIFLLAGTLSGIFVRSRPMAGLALAFASLVALLSRVRYFDGGSSGYLTAGMAWVMGSWLLLSLRRESPRRLSLKAQALSVILVAAWLYATLEWHNSPQLRSLSETSYAHFYPVLSNAAMSSGLTSVLAGFACLLGILSNSRSYLYFTLGTTAALFGAVFCRNAGNLIDFSMRHGESMSWAVPMVDHFCSWAYVCSILLFTAYVLKEIRQQGLVRSPRTERHGQ